MPSGPGPVAQPDEASFAGRAAWWRVVVPVGLGISVAPLDSSVNISLPDLASSFSVQMHSIQWVVIAYVLTYSCLLLSFGRLGDTVGHRRVFVTGMYLSMVALTACALAPSFEWLLLGRMAQGVGTALVLSTGPALMTLSFPAAERTRVVSQYALAFALAYAVGPLVGGVLVEHLGWPAVYGYRVIVVATACVLTHACMPAIALPPAEERFDVPAALAITIGLGAALLFVNQAARLGGFPAWVVILAGIAIIAFWWFARRQRRIAQPVIDLGLFRIPQFCVVNLTHALVNGSLFMIMLFGPFHVTRSAHGNEILGGVFLAMFPLGIAISSLFGRTLLGALGNAWLSRAAVAVVAAGLLGIALWPAHPGYLHLALSLLIPGLGYGLFQVASLDLVMGTMSRMQQGVAGSLNMVTRTMGVVLGASLGSVLFARAAAVAGDGAGVGFDTTFRLVFGGAFAVTMICLVLLLSVRAHGAEPQPDR